MPSTRSELVALDVFYRALDAGELVTLDVVTRRIEQLSACDHGLARVLLRCSYLCDGIAIT